MEIRDIERLCISRETRSREKHISEARRVVQANRRYRRDPNYKFFLKELVAGLCSDGANENAVELIRMLQKTIRPGRRCPYE